MKINSSLPGNQTLADTAASKSVIRHPKLPLVILRTDYLAIAQGNHCAAKLLAVFENWTNWFVRQGKPERWVRLTTEVIGQHLLGEHEKRMIQKAVALLVSLGFIRREQRRKRRHDRSWFYWFDIERVQEAIDALELPKEPETEQDYLKMDAMLEAETRVVTDSPETATQQLLKVTNDRAKMPYREDENALSNGTKMPYREGENAQSLNRHLNKEKISSSILPNAESGEEDLENLKKTEEKEATQVNASGTEGISKPQPPALLTDKPEPLEKPKESDLDQNSAAPREITKQPNSDEIIEDAAMLKWLVEVKIPKMELDDPPRNLLAYAKAMIRRDGDILREEFVEVVREHQFKEECDALTEKVEARVGEWRQAGMKVNLYFDSHGKPQALLDGCTLGANEFLAMPVGEKPTVLSISTLSGTDNAQNRTQRLSRLKMASTVGECPNFEFLVECYQDVLLRTQVKTLISRYPEWGIIVDSVGQLQVDF